MRLEKHMSWVFSIFIVIITLIPTSQAFARGYSREGTSYIVDVLNTHESRNYDCNLYNPKVFFVLDDGTERELVCKDNDFSEKIPGRKTARFYCTVSYNEWKKGFTRRICKVRVECDHKKKGHVVHWYDYKRSRDGNFTVHFNFMSIQRDKYGRRIR